MIDFVMLALAAYRIAVLVAQEDGPLDIFERFRALVGVRRYENGSQYAARRWDNGFGMALESFANGLICVQCNSVWIGVLWTIGFYFDASRQITLLLALPLALSTVAIAVNHMLER
jgi:hypothetical protein